MQVCVREREPNRKRERSNVCEVDRVKIRGLKSKNFLNVSGLKSFNFNVFIGYIYLRLDGSME